jgi:hypothetical protein
VTTACESEPLAFEEAAQLADDALETAVVAAAGSDDLRGAQDGARDRRTVFEQLAAEIPGFGGLYRTERCVVALVLTADADVESAVRIVHAVVEPLVATTCPDGIRVEPVRGQYTYIELRRFLHASRPLNNIPGVLGARIDFRHNSLVILVTSRRAARAVIQALPRVGIPEDAVLFLLGRLLERPAAIGTDEG